MSIFENLKSFQYSMYNFLTSSDVLTKNGFFLMSPPDLVYCAFCFHMMKINEIENQDVAFGNHFKGSPDCERKKRLKRYSSSRCTGFKN